MSTQTLNGKSIRNYPVFEGSQVLTSDQLNNLFEYLDQQNRYTRSRLTGVGIVCGLNLRTDGDKVLLSEGMGITSDGFLIKMPACEMRYRRDYYLPAGVFYEAFGSFSEDNIFSQSDDIVLYELLSQQPEDTGSQEIDEAFLSDMYFLIFLECFDRDPRSCLGKNCEDLGKERIFTIRKLAVNKAGLDKILEQENRIVGNPYFDVSALRFIDLPKPLFHPDEEGCSSYEAFFSLYTKAITESGTGENSFEVLFGETGNSGMLHQTYNEYESLLGPIYKYKNPLTGNARYTSLKSYLRSVLSGEDKNINIQLVYEFLVVVTHAYHEFASLGESLIAACCPDKDFPLHLLIGKIKYDEGKEADELNVLGESKYRHRFLQPEIHNSQAELRQQLINAHRRLILILECFEKGRISEEVRSLKITPSHASEALGDQSIPVFLDTDRVSSTPGLRSTTLEKEWNYLLTTRSRKMSRVLSYDANEIIAGEAFPAAASRISTPLYYNRQDGSYRIEGFYRAASEVVKAGEKEIKDHFNLPFDTLLLKLGEDTGEISIEEHYWSDMQSDYRIIVSGLIATFRNLLGELKTFVREEEDWEYDFPFANVENFKIIVTEVVEEITSIMGLCEEGEKFLTLLPDTIEALYNAGEAPVLFDTLLADYKKYRRNLSVTMLKLEYAAGILTHEKIEVLDTGIYHSWTDAIHTAREAIRNFLSNGEFFQLFSLYHRFVVRYEFLRENHYSLFCNFLRLHPGIEEKPVPGSGTHILLYENNAEDSETENPVVASFSLPYRLTPDAMKIPLDPALESVKLPPLARGEAILIEQKKSRCIDVTANDLDPNGDPLIITAKGYRNEEEETISVKGKSNLGAEVIFHEGEKSIIRYEAGTTEPGRDYFDYIIQNSKATELTDSVTVEVLVIVPFEKHIKAVDDLAATDSQHSVAINVLENDTTYSGTVVSLPESSSEFGASLSVGSEGQIIYTPHYGREGKDVFEYQIEYEKAATPEVVVTEISRAKVEVIVFCCDRQDFEVLCEGNKGYFNVLTTKESEQKAKLALLNEEGKPTDSLVNDNGRIEVINEGDWPYDEEEKPYAWLEFTPEPYYTGLQKFAYEITDDEGFVRRVKLCVLVQPCEETKLVRTLINTPCDFVVEGEKLNSVDLFEDRKELKGDLETANGSASIVMDDEKFSIRYKPDDNFHGLDMLQYAVTDENGHISFCILNIIVDGHETVRVESVFVNSDNTFELLTPEEQENGYAIKLYEEPMKFLDTLITGENGQVDIDQGAINYSPGRDFVGDDYFKYSILKNDKPVEYGAFHIIINDYRKVSIEYTQTDTPKDIFITVSSKAEHKITIQSGPGVSGATANVKNHGEDGEYVVYTPAPGYSGTDSFNYQLEKDGVSTFGTLYVIVEKKEKLEFVTVEQGKTAEFDPAPEAKNISSFEIINNTVHGESRWDEEVNLIRYRPDEGYTGTDKLTFKMVADSKVIYGAVIFVVVCPCQSFSVSGTVTDDGGNVVAMTDVSIVGGDVKTETGPLGMYIINASESDSLQFSKNTHETKVIDVSGRSSVNAILKRKIVKVTGSVYEQGGEMIGGAMIDSGLSSFLTDNTGFYELDAYAGSEITYTVNGYSTETRLAGTADSVIDVGLISQKANVDIRVTDKQSGTSLLGVQISEVGTDYAVISEYVASMEVPRDAVLSLEARGYEQIDINLTDHNLVAGRNELQVTMNQAMISTTGKVTDNNGKIITNALLTIGENEVIKVGSNGEFTILVPFYDTIVASASGYKNSLPYSFLVRETSSYLDVRKQKVSPLNEAVVNFSLLPDVNTLKGTVYSDLGGTISGAIIKSSSHTTTSDTKGQYEVLAEPGETITFNAPDHDQFVVSGIPASVPAINVNMRTTDRMRLVFDFDWSNEQQKARLGAATFLIGSDIYIVMGRENDPENSLNAPSGDILVYSTEQKSFKKTIQFPGKPRAEAISFVLENQAYVGLGVDEKGEELDDFWKFNPSEEKWEQITNFPGLARTGAVAFALEGKAYIGTGSYQGNENLLREFWAFDPRENQWTRVSDFGGGARRNAACFVIDQIAYVGTGWGVTNGFTDLWAFNAKDNRWSRKANFAGPMRQGAFGFSIDGNGFIGGGKDDFELFYTISRYQPDKDRWIRSFGIREGLANGFSVVIENTVFCGFGETEDGVSKIMRGEWKYWS